MKISPSCIRWVGAVGGLSLAFALGWWSRGDISPALPPARIAPTVVQVPPATARPHEDPDSQVQKTPVTSIEAVVAAAHRGATRAARLSAFALELERLPPADFAGLLQRLRATNGPDRAEAFAMLFDRWARFDGAGAFAAARALVATDGQHAALHSAIAAWSAASPGTAHAALRSSGLDYLASDEMTAFLRGWASRDHAAAESYLSSVAISGDVDAIPASVARGYEAIASARIAEDPMAALAWYRALGEPWQTRLRQAMAAELTVAGPALADQWLKEDRTAQLGTSDLVPLFRALEIEGFERQFAWAQSLANAETRESALAAVVRERASSDLAGFGEWLASRYDDAALAPAFAHYAAQVVRKSPTAAIAWALSLEDPALRQRTLDTVALEWSGRDPRSARQWAAESKLVDWASLVR